MCKKRGDSLHKQFVYFCFSSEWVDFFDGVPRHESCSDFKAETSLSGSWSKSWLENRGAFWWIFRWIFSCFFFQGKWPEKNGKKSTKKSHRGNQTPKSMSNFREGCPWVTSDLFSWSAGQRKGRRWRQCGKSSRAHMSHRWHIYVVLDHLIGCVRI